MSARGSRCVGVLVVAAAVVAMAACGQQVVEFKLDSDDAGGADLARNDAAAPDLSMLPDGAIGDGPMGDAPMSDAPMSDATGIDAADTAADASSRDAAGSDGTATVDGTISVDQTALPDQTRAADAVGIVDATSPADLTSAPADQTVLADSTVAADATALLDMTTPPDQFVNGPRCHAVLFDGLHAIVATPTPIVDYNPAGAVTVEAWVYPTQLGPSNNVVAAHFGDPAKGTASYLLVIDPTGRPSFTVSENGTTLRVITAVNPIPLNQWTHVAGVFDTSATGTTVYVFAGGVGASMGVLAIGGGKLRGVSNLPLTVGRLSSQSPQEWEFVGYIDEVRLSSIARYTGNFTPMTVLVNDSSTVALYHFDETGGAVAADSSSKDNPAALSQNAMFAVPPVCN